MFEDEEMTVEDAKADAKAEASIRKKMLQLSSKFRVGDKILWFEPIEEGFDPEKVKMIGKIVRLDGEYAKVLSKGTLYNVWLPLSRIKK